MKTNSLIALMRRALATTKSRLTLGTLLVISVTLLTSCAGGYIGTDRGDYSGSGYYANNDYEDSGPNLYIFGGGYDRGTDVRNYSRRGSYSRASSFHGGGGSHNGGGGRSNGGHSGGSHGGRR